MTHNIWHHYQYVVGVDPGFTCTGLAVHSVCGLVSTAWFKGDIGDNHGERMVFLAGELLCKAAAVTRPRRNRTLFSMEMNYVGKSAQTALLQRELIGVIEALAVGAGFTDFSRPQPNEAKLQVAGKGNASKDEVRAAAREVDGFPLGLPKYAEEAVADAVAAALAGIAKAEKELL